MKPLHVEVAEALGWTDIHAKGTPGCCGDITLPGTRYAGRAPGNRLVGKAGNHDPVPCYDTNWLAIGPVIERLRVGVVPFGNEWTAYPMEQEWPARPGSVDLGREGSTPLLAVCNLILALHEAGKLQS